MDAAIGCINQGLKCTFICSYLGILEGSTVHARQKASAGACSKERLRKSFRTKEVEGIPKLYAQRQVVVYR